MVYGMRVRERVSFFFLGWGDFKEKEGYSGTAQGVITEVFSEWRENSTRKT